jgi:hypothetical protein
LTYYDFSIISTHGFPYFNHEIKPVPQGVKVFLRFFDFSDTKRIPEQAQTKFELRAGLVSALFNFSNSIDKKIDVLEFVTSKNEGVNELSVEKGDVLITTTTESYLFHDQVAKKIKLIYHHFIYPKIPLDCADEIKYIEEKQIVNILTDVEAKNHLMKYKEEIETTAHRFLSEMNTYGLKAIIITSLDLSPLICFSNKNEYSLSDINEILRNIGNIPKIDPFEWKYRQSFMDNKQCWVFLINSGIGITVEKLFESYYYLLITEPNSYLGEFPSKLTSEFNDILT